MNEIVRQRLTPLIDPLSTIPVDGSGFSPYPLDLQQVDAMYTTSMQRIRYVPQQKLYSYLNSQIDPVATNPIFLIESGGFRFYPNTQFNSITIGSALLSYIKTPPAIKWSFVSDSNGRPVYDAGSSVGLIWYEVDCFEIVSRALAMVGVNLESQQVSQFANEITKGGQ